MDLILKKDNSAFGMELHNERGAHVHVNASPEIGGEAKGFRPMELLAGSLSACSSIDVLNILYKQKLKPSFFEVHTIAKRRDGEVPAIFENIHLEFRVSDDIPEDKVARAIQLSVEKYCSVSKILAPTCQITTKIKIIPVL
ncbi:MAG: OsmC family protein [Crocinitomicaceae bacterium]|nr:OsmC family protein [Crocinitomicaceae bacterium]